MEDENEQAPNPFTAILEDVVGFTPAYTTFITDQGITYGYILARVDDTPITEMFAKAQLRNVTVVMKMKFRAFRYWAQMALASNRPIIIEEF